MRCSTLKTLSLFAFTSLLWLTTTAGCSKVAEAIDCDQMCDKMKSCLDDDIDVRDRAERCEDRVDDSALADKLDACTDCLDHGVS